MIDHINLDKIELAYQIAARVVTKHGDAYMQVFERLHQEMVVAQARTERKLLALTIALEPLPKCT